MKKLDIQLPNELIEYEDVLRRSIRATNMITTTRKKCLLWESKLGGSPYFPKGKTYPKDEYGAPFRLLAQINFSEMPKLEHFPTKGILQIFLSEFDYYELDNNRTSQKNFKVIYHKDVCEDERNLVSNFDYLDFANYYYGEGFFNFPVKQELRFKFNQTLEPVSYSDFQFENFFKDSYDLFLEKFEDKKIAGTIDDFYYDNFSSDGYKIGGYACFSQDDPRSLNNKYKDYNILLLQIVSCPGANEFDLGEVGGVYFFINKEDLINLNFDKVLYNLDTY